MVSIMVDPPLIACQNLNELPPLIDEFQTATKEMRFFLDWVHKFLSREAYQLKVNAPSYNQYVSLKLCGITTFLKYMFPLSTKPPMDFRDVLGAAMRIAVGEHLQIKEGCYPLVAGRGGVGSQDELYAAWHIYGETCPNIYLVVGQQSRCQSMLVWLVEGDVQSFLSPEEIGWRLLEPKVVDETKLAVERMVSSDGGRETLRIKTAVMPAGFMDIYQLALEAGVISFEC